MSWTNVCTRLLVLTILGTLILTEARSEQMSNFDRDRALEMLDDVAKDVRKHYDDPTFHGIDWDAKVLETKRKIQEATP